MSLTPFVQGFNQDWGLTDPYANQFDTLTQPSRFNRGFRREISKPLAPLMAADLIETDTDFHIHADLPGVENLDISVKDGFLLMKAERKITHEVDTDLVHSFERSYGKVSRQIILPDNADGDKAAAKYKNGVLTVSIPKRVSGPAARKLTIN